MWTANSGHLKGTVSLLDPQCKDGSARFSTVALKP